MAPLELLAAVVVGVLTMGVGTVAHEFAHATVLESLGIPYDVEWFPGRGQAGPFGAGVSTTWASVTPRAVPDGLSPCALRVAAMAPLALLVPAALVLAGVLPDPLAGDDLVLTAVTVAWLGCALPSPQDFSVFWYPEEAVAEFRRSADGG
jgi:hypothetical protein